MDLIKSGIYIDIFYAKTCLTTKISTVAGYHVVLAALFLSYIFTSLFSKLQNHHIEYTGLIENKACYLLLSGINEY